MLYVYMEMCVVVFVKAATCLSSDAKKQVNRKPTRDVRMKGNVLIRIGYLRPGRLAPGVIRQRESAARRFVKACV